MRYLVKRNNKSPFTARVETYYLEEELPFGKFAFALDRSSAKIYDSADRADSVIAQLGASGTTAEKEALFAHSAPTYDDMPAPKEKEKDE